MTDKSATNGHIVLDPDLLTSRDMLRARKMLGGRNPFELLDDPVESGVLIVWCLVSRDQPDMTWDQALDLPLSSFAAPEPDSPPQTASPAANGASDATKPATRSAAKRRSAAGSASSRPSTTGSPSASSASGVS